MAVAAGCRKKDEAEQIGETVGEAMSSLDDSVAGESSAMLPLPFRRVPDELKGSPWQRAMDNVIPSAYAATCWEPTFSACSASGVRTKDFGGCIIGGATLEGTVTLTFNRALCVVLTAGDAVTRTADLTLTGRYGGTLAITSPGGGQTLTKTTDGFEYTVGGMERVLTGPGGRTLFDVATRTTAPIVVTGSSRADLKIASGSLEIDHKVAGYKVTLTANNLTWTSNCNCASSGMLSGVVSGGKHDGKTASVTITGCGEADVTIDGDTESVTMDRCTTM
ncbi:MAG TPA: hypothetical protein VN903_01950 [Polyangia bacterium]|jgi:hypothetical protein|nr:hypothetical protein [Polyangia bacterium]